MKAMVLKEIKNMEEENNPLELVDMEIPELSREEVLIKVKACGVCHTELGPEGQRAVRFSA